jgi:hypothetical protein
MGLAIISYMDWDDKYAYHPDTHKEFGNREEAKHYVDELNEGLGKREDYYISKWYDNYKKPAYL